MDSQRIVEIIDAHIFKQTKKHLDKIQLDILKSAFNGQKYCELATHYDVTEGHIRDKASELWKIISDVLGEEVKKSTVRGCLKSINVMLNDSEASLFLALKPRFFVPLRYTQNDNVDFSNIL